MARSPYIPLAAFALMLIFVAGDRAGAQDAGDPIDGAAVFQKQCASCHMVGADAKNGAGPVLNGLIGRKSGSYAEYTYTPQNRNARLTWDLPTLSLYLKGPKKMIPGTKMLFDGLSTPKEIADVIAYLGQFDAKGARKS